MTKAADIHQRIEEMVASGTTRADAFKQLSEELGIKPNSVRGAYYQATKGNGETKPRRRETTPEDALADARAALERAISNVDREVEAAKVRLDEAKAEYDSLKASATERKAAITATLEALK